MTSIFFVLCLIFGHFKINVPPTVRYIWEKEGYKPKTYRCDRCDRIVKWRD